jgi:CheY-like chemotaxis protein
LFAPDIVLLNLAMPKITGVMVAQAIRQGERGNLVHLVALTGFAREEDRLLMELTRFRGQLTTWFIS